jgi:hypothetical protein
VKHEPKPDRNIPGRYYCTCGAAGLTLEGQRLHAERISPDYRHRRGMTKDEFTEEFRALYHFSGLTLEAVAGRLKTSPLTVSRWLEGASAPHEVARSFTIQAMRATPRQPT